MKVETKIKILILCVLFFGTMIYGSIVYLFGKWPIWTMLGVMGISLFWPIANMIPSPRNKTARKIYKLLYYPVAAITILFGIAKPSIGIICAYLFAFGISMIPAIIVWGIYVLCIGLPSPELTVFISVTFSTILLSNHTDLIKKLLKTIFVWNAWSKNESQIEFVKIGEYVLQPGNVHFIVSMLYVVFLAFYALQAILKYEPFIPPTLSDAILKAFLVYVAYTTMMKRYGEQEISTKGMSRAILEMYHFLGKENSKDSDDKDEKREINL